MTITAEFSSRQMEVEARQLKVEASTYDKISDVCSKFVATNKKLLHRDKYTCCLLVKEKILNPKKRVSQYMNVIDGGARMTLEHFGE